MAAVLTAALYGWSSNSPWRNAGDATVNPVVAASPAPEAGPATRSVDDALELAANAPSPNNNAGIASTPGAQAMPGSAQQTQTAASTAANNKDVAQTALPPTPAPVPAPIPPGTRPQMPPTPSLDIALKRPTQPASVPNLSQGPVKERGGAGQRRENDSATGDSNQGGSGDMDPDADRVADYNPPSRRGADTLNRGRMPDPPNQDRANQDGEDRDDYDDDDSGSIRPRLYHWSGRVNYEREITIELPGAPGKVEIPRAYRKRVGVIEPPSANNGWRFVVLRVFGQGGVSIIVRWWPAARNGVKLTAHRL
jgi:hypothetical protein